jgi:hypothetical protein
MQHPSTAAAADGADVIETGAEGDDAPAAASSSSARPSGVIVGREVSTELLPPARGPPRGPESPAERSGDDVVAAILQPIADVELRSQHKQ